MFGFSMGEIGSTTFGITGMQTLPGRAQQKPPPTGCKSVEQVGPTDIQGALDSIESNIASR
jgi:hypothetical protein